MEIYRYDDEQWNYIIETIDFMNQTIELWNILGDSLDKKLVNKSIDGLKKLGFNFSSVSRVSSSSHLTLKNLIGMNNVIYTTIFTSIDYFINLYFEQNETNKKETLNELRMVKNIRKIIKTKENDYEKIGDKLKRIKQRIDETKTIHLTMEIDGKTTYTFLKERIVVSEKENKSFEIIVTENREKDLEILDDLNDELIETKNDYNSIANKYNVLVDQFNEQNEIHQKEITTYVNDYNHIGEQAQQIHQQNTQLHIQLQEKENQIEQLQQINIQTTDEFNKKLDEFAQNWNNYHQEIVKQKDDEIQQLKQQLEMKNNEIEQLKQQLLQFSQSIQSSINSSYDSTMNSFNSNQQSNQLSEYEQMQMSTPQQNQMFNQFSMPRLPSTNQFNSAYNSYPNPHEGMFPFNNNYH